MNGYFVRQDILEVLDRLAYLEEMLHGLEQNTDGLKPEEIEEQIAVCHDTIEAVESELEPLAEMLASDIRNAEMEAKAYKAEAEIWKTKQYKAEQRAKNEKSLLMHIMKKHGKEKMDAGKFKLTIANNGGKTPLTLFVEDPAELPSKFRTKTIVYKADDAAIREYLDSGKTSKYFAYGPRGQNLRIK